MALGNKNLVNFGLTEALVRWPTNKACGLQPPVCGRPSPA